MEFDGTEKRIQALFSELSLEDHRRAPRFERLWTRGEHTTPAPVFKPSLALTAAAVVIAASISFALWSTRSESALNIAPLELPTTASPQLAVVVESPRAAHPRQKRIARPRQPESVAIREAALLSRWQSPTQNFMQSPASVSFNSLPQLDQSAKDLESFLPKKESNQ
jgi:hypothetical protein